MKRKSRISTTQIRSTRRVPNPSILQSASNAPRRYAMKR